LIQALQLVDFSCATAECWIAKYEETRSIFYQCLLIGSTLLCFSSIILITVFLYLNNTGCWINQFIISITALLTTTISLLSITKKFQKRNPKFGILQAALISLYGTYLMASAVTMNSNDICGSIVPVTNATSGPLAHEMKYLGLAFTLLSLGYTAFSTGTTAITGSPEPSFAFFHFIYTIAALYMSQVLTQWSQVTETSSGQLIIINGSQANYWLQITTSFLCFVLYLWVLIAPTVMQDRSFA
jgi:hypothetical protein